jgi:hypothetical protein
MKNVVLAILMVATLAIAGCGSGSHSGNVDGNWTAALTDANGTPVFAFGTTLTATGNGSTVTVSNFNFTSDACSLTVTSETASFVLSGNFNGSVKGSFALNLLSGSPNNNTLTLNGTVNGGTISGTWTLSGTTSCATNGNFTMTKV